MLAKKNQARRTYPHSPAPAPHTQARHASLSSRPEAAPPSVSSPPEARTLYVRHLDRRPQWRDSRRCRCICSSSLVIPAEPALIEVGVHGFDVQAQADACVLALRCLLLHSIHSADRVLFGKPPRLEQSRRLAPHAPPGVVPKHRRHHPVKQASSRHPFKGVVSTLTTDHRLGSLVVVARLLRGSAAARIGRL